MNILWDGIVINIIKAIIDNFTCEGNRQYTLYKYTARGIILYIIIL